MRSAILTQINDHPVKTLFSIFCGWVYGLASYGHVFKNLGLHIGLHIGPFPHLNPAINDGIQYVISFIKAIGLGGASLLGATLFTRWNRKYKSWKENRKRKK